MKIQTRVTLLYLFQTTFLIILLSGYILFFSYEFTFGDFYKRLEARVKLTAQVNFMEGKDSLVIAELRRLYLEKLPSETDYILPIVAGKINSKDLKLKPSRDFFETAFKGQMAKGRNDKIFYAGTLYKKGDDKFLVLVSATDPYGFSELNALQNILITGVIFSTIFILLSGKLFSSYTFKPIRDIVSKVKEITAQNLHLRIDPYEGSDEISELSQTFNDMLNRLETAFETQNNFVSNASHELRTPLTVITSETELALQNALQGKSNIESLKTIIDESEKLKHILTSLLELAQSGFDGKKQHWEKIRVDELILEVKQSVDQLNPKNNVQINFNDLPEKEEYICTEGNKNLLKLALNNIIVNAIKYSDNNNVQVSLSSNGKTLSISVLDKGIGIPENELQHVFVPFFRASNTTDYEGHGVGLPLALNIIRLHRGNIGIRTQEKEGTEIQILLPVG